jgi:sulfane dehydrogenase subunit SoxC
MAARGGPRPPGRGAALSRRRLLAGASGLVGGLAMARAAGAQTDLEAPADPTKVPGPAPSEVGGRSPYVRLRRRPVSSTSSRTPLDELTGIITPADLHFERHHSGIPTIDPASYRLLVHGLVERPLFFSLADLRRFPAVSRLYFLECGGNNVSWDPANPRSTASALAGLTSTSDWTGVPVRTLLREVGLSPRATWALAEGMDAAVMTRSVPIEKLLDDALVAYAQNGEPLQPGQGYPARLLLPGWEGNACVKWLRRLKLGDGSFETREETSKYTDIMPDGTSRQYTFVMEARSIITWPSAEHDLPERGFWEIQGLAWSGRGRITRVEVSADGGASWSEARLDEPVLPLCHTRFRWPWTWDGGEAVLQSRATDETGYVQPTREQLIAVRGTLSRYHYNGIASYHVATDGTVTNVDA